MENELNLLLRTAIDSLLKLEILLYLHERPGEVRTAKEVGRRLRRPPEEVTPALEALAQTGLIARFPLGSGRHVIYGPSDDSHVRELLNLLHAWYHQDPVSRARLVREAMGRGEEAETEPESSRPRS